jgi:hypothetical protein
LVVAICVEVLLEGLISSFSLTIAFRVVTRGEVKTDVESFSEGAEEVRDKFHALIGGDMSRYTVLREDMQQEKLGEVMVS